MSALLEVEGLEAWYGESHVLRGVSFAVAEGTVTSVVGRNGAGKTTLLRTVMGLVARRRGEVRLAGRALSGLAPHRVARAGLAWVPETRNVFPSLSVEENLAVAARPGGFGLAGLFELFPRLAERRGIGGGRLSGGEQQMLAIARALATNGRLLLLDEPTEGLAPAHVAEIAGLLARLKAAGQTVLLVEQTLPLALSLADRVLVLGRGEVRWEGPRAAFDGAADAVAPWLGV